MLDVVRTADASFQDWSEIWPILRHVAQAGETFCWQRDISEDQARAYWMQPPPNLTLVLRDAGAVAGTATLHPNHAGPAMHVANASFAVDPAIGLYRRPATVTSRPTTAAHWLEKQLS